MVTGGKADDEDVPEIFSAGSWADVAVTPSHLYNHCQVNLAGRIYLVGGRGRHDRLEYVRHSLTEKLNINNILSISPVLSSPSMKRTTAGRL